MVVIEDNTECCIKNCNELAEYNYKFFFVPHYCVKHKKINMLNMLINCEVCQEKYKKYEHCKNCSEFEQLFINKHKHINKKI